MMFPQDMQHLISEIDALATDDSLGKDTKTQRLADKLWEFELLQSDYFFQDRVTITLDLPKEYLSVIDALVESKSAILH